MRGSKVALVTVAINPMLLANKRSLKNSKGIVLICLVLL